MPSRFYDGQTARAHPVTVTLGQAALAIRSVDGAVMQDWPFPRVTVQASPDGSLIVRLHAHPARLVIADPALATALRPHIGRWPKQPAGWAVLLWPVAAVVVAAVLLVTAAPALLAPLVPLAWEQAAGRAAEAAILAGHGRCTGADGQAALDGFTARIAASASLPPMRITVVDDGLVNAFTLPGGHIVLERGLIDAAEDGEELAGVLGHEIGHVAHRDTTRALIRELGFGLVAAALGWGGSSSGGLAQHVLDLSYSRAAESAADAFAVHALHGAGLRSDGLGRFFAHMAGQWPSGPTFLSDHPATADRQARVAQPEGGELAFTPAEWQAIRTMCRHRP